MSQPEIRSTTTLDQAAVDAVRDLIGRATAVDGVSPVNELGGRAPSGGRPGRHWLAQSGERITGWAWLDPEDDSVQLVVDPDARGRGVGAALVGAVRAQAQPRHWWSFGTLDAAARLASSAGLSLERQLLIMERDLDAHPADPVTVPEGVDLVGFTQADIEDLVRVNHEAFADHPEQGAMTAEDVRTKMVEPWFDAEGLLLAKQQGTGALMGFHWTKIERSEPGVGEVYVIGVAPDFEHRGLGRFLLNAGLAWLADRGVHTVRLYVEASSSRVVQMYSSANFGVHTRDSSYAEPSYT